MVSERTAQGAPYAPLRNVMSVITRYRDRGLPETITAPVLQQIGIPGGNAPRTLQALRFLRLLDDEGHKTQIFDRLRVATTEDYPSLLAEIVRNAYASVFTIADPAQDDLVAISDAFRQYEPAAQRGRMVTLFLGLCREAGIVPSQATRKRQAQGSQPRSAPVQRQRQRQQRATPTRGQEASGPSPHDTEQEAPDYRLVFALIQQLPKEKKWTKIRRDRWIQAMGSAIDLLIETSDE